MNLFTVEAGANADDFTRHHILQRRLAHQGFELILRQRARRMRNWVGHLGKSGELQKSAGIIQCLSSPTRWPAPFYLVLT